MEGIKIYIFSQKFLKTNNQVDLKRILVQIIKKICIDKGNKSDLKFPILKMKPLIKILCY